MDIASHGLWGGVAFGRKNIKSFWLSLLFGVLPDLLAFGPFFVGIFLGFYQRPLFNGTEPPNPALIPSFVGQIYNITHSLIIFAAVFLIVWFILKRPVYEMLAWGLHILFDIPTHSYAFFPTPFLWPISAFKINGVHWGDPIILYPNIILLLILYIWFFKYKCKVKL